MPQEVTSQQETRKVQLTGGKYGSFAVSLPKSWARSIGLKKKDRIVFVKEPDGRLTLYPEDMHPLQTIKKGLKAEFKVYPQASTAKDEGSCREIADMLIRKVIAAYLVGYDEIHLKGLLSKEIREEIGKFVKDRLLGLDQVVSDYDLLRLRVLSLEDLSLETVMNDIRDSVLKMLNLTKDLLDGQSYREQTAGFIEWADKTIARYYFYVVRQLKAASDNPARRSELKLRNGRDLLGLRLMLKSIERISNHSKKIASLAGHIKYPVSEEYGKECISEIKRGIDMAIDVFQRALASYPLLGKSDFETANEAVRDARREVERIRMLLDSMRENKNALKNVSSTPAISNVMTIVESVMRACEYAGDVAEIVLNLTIEDLMTPFPKRK